MLWYNWHTSAQLAYSANQPAHMPEQMAANADAQHAHRVAKVDRETSTRSYVRTSRGKRRHGRSVHPPPPWHGETPGAAPAILAELRLKP
jgi:hypothetical protein